MVGFVDVAGKAGLEVETADFGQTLATWGVGEGPYVVLPIFGGSTLRDAVGMVPDAYMHPLMMVEDAPTRMAIYGVELIDTRAGLLDLEEVITGDRYIFLRDAYLQHRRTRLGVITAEDSLEDSGFTDDDFFMEEF